MRFSPLLVASFLFLLPDPSTECCCNWWVSCRCNIFGCNCDTDDAGYCYKRTYLHHSLSSRFAAPTVCRTSRWGKNPEHCEYGRRRKKRSVTGTILEAEYAGGIYNHLMDQKAMETFLNFDLNKDGQISREEANATLEEFKQVDENNDGFVQPGELDISLK